MPPIKKAVNTLRNQGAWPLVWKTAEYTQLWNFFWNSLTSRYPIGTNIFEREWDLLIILDTCRADSLETVLEPNFYSNNIGEITSVGSMSPEWMLNTFVKKYKPKISETALITGNVWAHRIFKEQIHTHSAHEHRMINHGFPSWNPVSSDDFGHYEYIFPEIDNVDPLHSQGTGRIPHILTDRAISVARENSYDRIIVHYLLPHLPLIADSLNWRPGKSSTKELMDGFTPCRELKPYEKSYASVIKGEVEKSVVHNAYLQNLRLVVEYVKILVNNVDLNKVIVSADHGESLGEHGVWGHPYGYPLPTVKKVPWVQIPATNNETYSTKYDKFDAQPSKKDLNSRLKNLGYM